MKTKVLLLSVFVLSLVFSNQLLAQHENHVNCKDHKNHKKECLMDDLTEEQKTKIEAIKFESQSKVKVYKADLDIKKAELKKLEIADEPSEKDIHAKIDEMTSLKADIQKERASARIDIRSELTPEQRVKFDSHKSNRKMSMKNSGMKSHHKALDCEHKHLNPDCKNK